MSFESSFRQLGKVGRNALCPCESGKKWKRCHGNPVVTRVWTFDHPKLGHVWTNQAADRTWATAAFKKAWDDAAANGSLPEGSYFEDGKVDDVKDEP